MKRKNLIATQQKKGFSLVELVVVILIIAVLAVAVFAGGSASIRKAQVSRVSSDLHNFDIAMSTYMNENRSLVNLTNSAAKAEFDKEIQKLNKVLPADYAFSTNPPDLSGTQFTMDASLIAYQSSKADPWGNPYMLIIDTTDRNSGLSEYYLTTVSAGPNAQANLSGTLDVDDIFLLSQYSDGEVSSHVYNMSKDTGDTTGSPINVPEVSTFHPGYVKNGSAVNYAPRNTGGLLGDLDGNGVVNNDDCNMILSMSTGNIPKDDAADLNGNGAIAMNDVMILNRLILYFYQK